MARLSDDAFAFGGDLLSVETALGLVAERIPPVSATERVGLAEADGRVLAAPLTAPIDLPGFDHAAIDGFAFSHATLAPDRPTILPLAGSIAAGHGADAVVPPGSAIRIAAGAAIPLGCDTVVRVEEANEIDGDHVSLPPRRERGANVRRRGEDIRRGAEALPAGRRLDPRDLALAAALGAAEITARVRPRVAVFSTGDEIVEPGGPLAAVSRYDSNRFALRALLGRAGCAVNDLGILRDDPIGTAERIAAAARDHDLVVTSGGVSGGEGDPVSTALAARGSLSIWHLAVEPGRPLAMGVVDGAAIVGLPGDPVAAFVGWAHVVRPIVAALAGSAVAPIVPQIVTADFGHTKRSGRRTYLRVSLSRRGGHAYAVEYPAEGAGVVTSLTRTDGLVELSEKTTRVVPGDPVAFLDYRLLQV